MRREKFHYFLLVWFLLIVSNPILATQPSDGPKFNWFRDFFFDVQRDYIISYGKENLPRLGGTLLVAGVLANTGIDRSIKDFWQENIRSKGTNAFFKPQKKIGLFNYKKVYIGSIILGYWTDHYVVGNVVYQWGYRSFRGLLLGSPQVTLLRNLLGGGRPCQSDQQEPHPYSRSKWRFFKYGRPSCSGHTFNGALPFLTAAMMTDIPVYRYGFYVLSVLPGLGRINDNKHYFSQALLGWSIAFLSVKVVDESDKECQCPVKMGISEVKDGTMVQASLQF